MKYEHCDCWAFAWSGGYPRPYITTIVASTRRQLIQDVQEFMGVPWRKTHRQGGRAVKCQIVQKDKS